MTTEELRALRSEFTADVHACSMFDGVLIHTGDSGAVDGSDRRVLALWDALPALLAIAEAAAEMAEDAVPEDDGMWYGPNTDLHALRAALTALSRP